MTARDPLAAIEGVRRACVSVDGHDPVDESVHLRLKNHGLAGTDAWVETDGFALRHEESLDLAVTPAARGRGIGRRLADAAMSDPGPLSAWSHGDHPAAAAIARSHGFSRHRELWVMRRSSTVPLPETPPPAGVRICDFDEAPDVEALLAVNAAAFADHPEQGAMSSADLAERMAEQWFDSAGLLLALDRDDRLLGFHWTKRHDADHGEVYVIGIAPDAHGRGLGRALTVAGLRHLVDTGVREVHLYVEADNTPALALYRSLDFRHASADTHVQYFRSSHDPQAAPQTGSAG